MFEALALRSFATGFASRRTPARAAPAATVGAALRPVRPTDAAAIAAFVDALSPASRRLRFHAAMQCCPPALAAQLAAADGEREVAIVATLSCDDGGAERIVGEARFAIDGRDAACAEFAIAVADDQRGNGLARRLVDALTAAARERGVRWLHGEVLEGNARMLAFTERMGFHVAGHAADGIVRVERSTAATPCAAGAAGDGWVAGFASLLRQRRLAVDVAAALPGV